MPLTAAERLVATSTPRGTFSIPIRIPPAELPPCDDSITVEIPMTHAPIPMPGGQLKPWSFQLFWPVHHPQWSVDFPPGVHSIPRAMWEQWEKYFVAHGVKIIG